MNSTLPHGGGRTTLMVENYAAKMGLNGRWNQAMSGALNSFWKLALGLIFVATVACAPDVFAQQRDRQRDREADELDIQQRSFNLRMLHIMAKQRKPRRDPQLALAQVQEDFTHIQMLNKKLGLSALGSAELDLKFVNKAAGEINKRAERLRDNLALPEPLDLAQPFRYTVENSSQLKAPIVHLARLILNFTDNPYFKEASVLETQQADKARRDLENIIIISNKVRDLSKRLNNSGAIH